MKRVSRLVRWACLAGGLAGLVASVWALIDPSAFPSLGGGGLLAPPSPRWRAALGFVFSLLVLGYGSTGRTHRNQP